VTTIDENLLGLLIAGPVFLSLVLGFVAGYQWSLPTSPLRETILITFAACVAISLVLAGGFMVAGFAEGVAQ
jgi:hypothetical protein